ncbi:MAG: flagellin [Methanospirillum sp.]|uniref:archaellin/type IV pilin N-terminal domain-containing protein n=1 Tax=Methanospirillum sp. TaxID=45200 RepID=UPI00237420F5|nr:archaellin/type IV pilin N-terminal domain-containing protein [Methanospirillum sp.]MDD1728824.1 flagellin [Methanospirillum sp.]
MQKDDAFTGLEAAIIVIAFVVVAAVFAYTVLGSGFYVTQEYQTQVHAGQQSSQSSLYQQGGLYGTLYDSGTYKGQLQTLTFSIYIPDTGLDQDLTEMIISYTESNIQTPKDYEWAETDLNDGHHFYTDGIKLLKAGQNCKVKLSDVQGPSAGGWFSIELRPKRGSPTVIKRYLASGYEGGSIY